MRTYTTNDFRNTNIENGFWHMRQRMNNEVTIHSVMNRFKETGRFDAFKFEWKKGMKNEPHIFWDSDIGKWIESVAYILEKKEDKILEDLVDEVVDLIEEHQDPSGYFNIYFTVVEPENRWKRRTDHELYCAGHLFEGAVAYAKATGKDKFLKLMCKYAEHIEDVFVKQQSAAFVTCGHEEIELALVKMYEATNEKRYLELGKFFIDKRGTQKEDYYDWANSRYAQDYAPVREQTTAEGHSVRACYLYMGMADFAHYYDDKELLAACKTLMRDITHHKMYITGGIGSTHKGEAFTIPYDLPNMTAYTESCAAIALILFANRLLAFGKNAEYGDVVERTLYNGFLSSTSLDGKAFFYENPLEIDPRLIEKDVSIIEGKTHFPITQRLEVFGCSCCPPNITRFIASVGDLLYTYNEKEIVINQFMDSTTSIPESGIQIVQQTAYPLDGKIKLTVNHAKGKELAIRIPAWCKDYRFSVSGGIAKDGYMVYENIGDFFEVTIAFNMVPKLIESNPKIQENAGRVAVTYGPFVYCIEGVDNGENLRDLKVSDKFQVTFDEKMGVPILLNEGFRRKQERYDGLYCEKKENALIPQPIRLIPYFAFANRGETEMIVWLQN